MKLSAYADKVGGSRAVGIPNTAYFVWMQATQMQQLMIVQCNICSDSKMKKTIHNLK